MAKYNLTTLRRKTRDLLRDQASTALEWTDEQVDRALNWAQETVARETGLTYMDAPRTGMTGGGPPTFAAPLDSIRVVRVYRAVVDGGPVSLLIKTNMMFEDAKDPDWRSKVGTPSKWLEQNGNTLRVIPAPNAAIDVTVGYIQRPTAMVAPDSYPDPRIMEYYHEPLKYGAAYYLINIAAAGDDLKLADVYLSKFNALIGAGPTTVAVNEVDR